MQDVSFRIVFDNSYKLIRTRNIQNLSLQLNSDLQEYISEIDMPTKWTFENATEIEIKKSILRSRLRYSVPGINFSVEVAKIVMDPRAKNSETLFHTMIYPMIHLAGDKSEEGEFHTDQIGAFKLRTSWTAITNYGYDPLRFVPFGLLGTALSQRIFHKPIPRNLGISIKADQGDTLTWGGGFYHCGNLNQTGNTTCAAVIRISSQPLHLEPSRIIRSDPSPDISIKPGNENADLIQLVEVLNKLFSWSVKLRADEIDENLCIEIIELLHQNSCLEQPSISFALSLLAQRIRTKNLFFQDNQKSMIVAYVLDLMSILSGPENLSSLKNIMASKVTPEFGIIKQIEYLLKGNNVLKSKSWPIVAMKSVPDGLPIWKF